MNNYPRVKSILDQGLIGNAKNGYSDKSFWFVFGKNSNVDNALLDLWEGPTARYVFPTVAQQMEVVSSDNTNDKAAGTGALTVEIHYLDGDYAEQTETVTLDGTTPVNTVATDILRINWFHVLTAGTGGAAAGNISLRNTAGTVTYSYISATETASRQAIYTVPAGKTGYINHWQSSSGSSAGNHFTQMSILAKMHEWVLCDVFLPIDEVGTQDGGISINFATPIKVPAQCDVKISVISDSGTANVIALGAIMWWFETD